MSLNCQSYDHRNKAFTKIPNLTRPSFSDWPASARVTPSRRAVTAPALEMPESVVWRSHHHQHFVLSPELSDHLIRITRLL